MSARSGEAPTPIELNLPARPESAARARRAVTGYAERLGADLAAIRSAVSEAVTNAAVHAYPGGRGEIVVKAAVDAGELVVTVTDRGTGIRPDYRHAGLGLGLPIIGKLADQVRVESGRGTRVEMRFRI